jgi:hypothetical protein
MNFVVLAWFNQACRDEERPPWPHHLCRAPLWQTLFFLAEQNKNNYHHYKNYNDADLYPTHLFLPSLDKLVVRYAR